jgi:hypothetical protein
MQYFNIFFTLKIIYNILFNNYLMTVFLLYRHNKNSRKVQKIFNIDDFST